MKTLSKQEEIALLLKKARRECAEIMNSQHCGFNLCDYIYTTNEAISELGLDDELVHQLVEDYVEQIIKTKQLFIYYISQLQDAKQNNQKLDYIPLRELAHKKSRGRKKFKDQRRPDDFGKNDERRRHRLSARLRQSTRDIRHTP